MSSKKFYAIAAGRKPGVYANWSDAEAQIKGYPRARYRGFATKEEAEKWLQAPSATPARQKIDILPAKKQNGHDTGIEIYTDGGALGNPGPGGYGIVMISGNRKKELCGGYRLTTNNRMELMGCIVALQELKQKNRPITLYSDSSYVVNGINKGWAKSWRKNGWIKSDKKPAMNHDLWAELLKLTEGLDIIFKWVKGHAGNPNNERCDELAVSSAKQYHLPTDTGYEQA
jgi:ribonuclease HI